MAVLTTLNNRIACEPFNLETKVSANVQSGFATTGREDTLLKTRVVLWSPKNDKDDIALGPGDTVYFRRDVLGHAWATEVFNLNGQKVVFLPRDMIVLVEEE